MHRYEKNPDGPVGNELDLKEGDTVVYLMKHDDNDHCMVAGRGWKGTGGIRASGLSHDHHR